MRVSRPVPGTPASAGSDVAQRPVPGKRANGKTAIFRTVHAVIREVYVVIGAVHAFIREVYVIIEKVHA